MDAIKQARKAIESQYKGKCTIIEYQSYKKENKSTGKHEIAVLENQSCKLSYSSSSSLNVTDTASKVTQVIKLFIAPEITIKPGSKLIISQNGVTTEYSNSGTSAIYETHQEIELELFKEWS